MTTTWTSATEDAATIRARLKAEHGWTSRQVSVRADQYSGGSSLDVRIKDPTVPLPVVKAIAEERESIRRCEITHEILSGGNRFVHVRYSPEALAVLGARWLPAVSAAVALVEPGSNRLLPVEGTPFLVGRPDAHRITLWEDGFIAEGSPESLAETIGERLVARGAGVLFDWRDRGGKEATT